MLGLFFASLMLVVEEFVVSSPSTRHGSTTLATAGGVAIGISYVLAFAILGQIHEFKARTPRAVHVSNPEPVIARERPG
jgi:hypothetical protein